MALVVSKEELCHSLGGLAAWVGGQDPSSAETLAQPQQRKEKDLVQWYCGGGGGR